MLPPVAEYTLHKPSHAYKFRLAFEQQLLSLDDNVLTYMQKPLQQNQDVLCRGYHKYRTLRHRLLPKPTDGEWFVLGILESPAFVTSFKLSVIKTGLPFLSPLRLCLLVHYTKV